HTGGISYRSEEFRLFHVTQVIDVKPPRTSTIELVLVGNGVVSDEHVMVAGEAPPAGPARRFVTGNVHLYGLSSFGKFESGNESLCRIATEEPFHVIDI